MSDLEQALSAASERLVAGGAFATLLARSAENTLALASLSNGLLDLAWRNLRLAGSADVARLGVRLNRTEDKIERLLQEIEALREGEATR
jgi:hypothetical protein